MGRAEFGTAKYQAKQLKASGLQKLKYYCQLCQKQCRDANGFKNHLQSPSHLGRISSIKDEGKGSSVVEDFSSRFEKEFLRLLRINHGTKRINANKFYQEYILNDKNHVHMNATKWQTLTSFIKYLGRLGKLQVDVPQGTDDEFNLEIRLFDTANDNQIKEKEKLKRTDEESTLKFIQNQVLKGKEMQLQNNQDAAENLLPFNEVKQKPLPTSKVLVVLKGLAPQRKKTLAAFTVDSDED